MLLQDILHLKTYLFRHWHTKLLMKIPMTVVWYLCFLDTKIYHITSLVSFGEILLSNT